MAVFSTVIGNNDTLIKSVMRLYANKGDKIADVTYGKGVFWKGVDIDDYDFWPSDKVTREGAKYDFRNLPYADDSFDILVFDPPYCHNPGDMIVDDNYQNKSTTQGMYHTDILALYQAGMIEAMRVVKEGGTIWVKCKDEVESGWQRWSHIEIFATARELLLVPKDLFILLPQNNPVIQHKSQKHSRKNHSFLWVFYKPTKQEIRSLAKHGLLKVPLEMWGTTGNDQALSIRSKLPKRHLSPKLFKDD